MDISQLLDFSQPLNVPLLDAAQGMLNSGAADARKAANQVLTQLQQHPDAWLRVDAILEVCILRGSACCVALSVF